MDGRPLVLAVPNSYMNLSGGPVRSLSNHMGYEARHVVVIHDDISLPLGSIRLRNRGSSGGQNGVENIIKCMGGASSRFIRVRIGIAPLDGVKPLDLARFVLKKFTVEEQAVVKQTTRHVKACIERMFAMVYTFS